MTKLINGKVIDVRSGEIQERDIYVQGDRIGKLAKRGAESEYNGLTLDLQGAYVLPGFFDCHVHICTDSTNPDSSRQWVGALPGTIAIYAAQAAHRMLMAGITTARDCGGWDYHEIAVREAIRSGWIEGSRLQCSGRILSITSSTTRYYSGMYAEADGPDAVRRAAREQFARGAQFIKLLATGAVLSTEYENPLAIQYGRDEIAAAVHAAEDNLSYVAAHAHSPEGISNAVEAGCRSIEHTVYGNEEVYRLMVARGTFLVPTLCIVPALFSKPEFADQVPRYLRDRLQDVHEVHVRNIALARKVGVKVAMGTDAGTPGNHFGENLQELEIMVEEAGFSPLEAIQSATMNAAELMRLADALGAIEVGKIADLVVTLENPLRNIHALRSMALVMKEGRVVKNKLAGGNPV